jgi:hypothetical protein
MLNDEHVNAFGNYLGTRIDELGGTEDDPTILIEVGAGNGRLSHFIREKLNTTHKGKFKLIATDDTSWDIANQFPVMKIDYTDAINLYKPAIIISSWMPYSQDWTKIFRKLPNTKEYILIGEPNGGGCGSDETWGIPPREYYDQEGFAVDYIPDYVKEGFERVDHPEITQFNICRADEPGYYYHSATVSFRKTT